MKTDNNDDDDDDDDDANKAVVMQVSYWTDSSTSPTDGSSSSVNEGRTVVDGSSRQLQTCSLFPLTLYHFSVSAVTRAGHPGPAVERTYWTEVSAPPVPPSPSLTGVTASSVSLLLQPVTSTPGRPTSVTTYFVVVNDLSPAAVRRRRRRRLSLATSRSHDSEKSNKYCRIDLKDIHMSSL